MFSKGQLLFALLFIISFSIILIRTYRKDKELHSKNYKGVKWVGLFFALFIIFLFSIKYLLKN
nr:hypothetical protein [Eudoraea chungangensis]